MSMTSIRREILKMFEESNYYNIGMDAPWLEAVLTAYRQPHRYFHTLVHVHDIMKHICKDIPNDLERKAQMMIVALFHDVVYYPNRANNVDMSVEAFDYVMAKIGNPLPDDVATLIRETILATEIPSHKTKLSEQFNRYDYSVLLQKDTMSWLEYEDQIFHEFQFANYAEYKRGRLQFLADTMEKYPEGNAVAFLTRYILHRRPRIGIYAGTFNPFHVGHMYILNQAERMFDKVMVVVGVNPAKESHGDSDVESVLPFHEVVHYDQLMVDLIQKESEHCDVTLVRGLRNGYDLDYEMNQLSFMRDMMYDIKVCYIPCMKQLEHVSSSALCGLKRFKVGNRADKYYPNIYQYVKWNIKDMFDFYGL